MLLFEDEQAYQCYHSEECYCDQDPHQCKINKTGYSPYFVTQFVGGVLQYGEERMIVQMQRLSRIHNHDTKFPKEYQLAELLRELY